MEYERYDPISIDSRSSEREVVGRVGVDDVAYHIGFQVSDLTLETDLAQRITTPGVETVYDRSHD